MGRRSRISHLEREPLQQLGNTQVTLRPPLPEDLEAIHAYAADPAASRFLAWRPHRDKGETELFLQGCITAWQGEERLPWVIVVQGVVVGMIEAKLRGRNAGIGYVIAPSYWGRGYASAALGVVSEALFRHSPAGAIWALCVTQNPASARVLERCGYQREKLIPRYFPCPNLGGERYDVWRYVRYRHPTQSGRKPV